MGCYWAAEALFGATSGVLRTRVGYSGGSQEFSYSDIGDHTEAVEIEFDPSIISYEELLHIFWNNHEYDYTVKTKRKYMSMVLYHSEEQKEIAEHSKIVEQTKRSPETIRTEISQATIFHPSEDHQQKYRLQQHKDFMLTLGMNSELLQKSYVAAKLNGYLVGSGTVKQFENEIHSLGLTPSQADYVKFFFSKFEGVGLSC
ncbi:peptide methionine sulfoxide reductase-like isoform X2 [Condylostylus longicornis]|nr:peptide methionine sulfoxide reductase-like isoform X2 [Condylostylus longicornis]